MALSLNDYLHSLGLSSYNINDVLYHLPDYLSSTYTTQAQNDARYTIQKLMAPAAAIAETYSRQGSLIGNSGADMVSGTLRVSAIPLLAGQTVTSITFISGNIAAATSSHVWFSLWSPPGLLLGVTNDDTAASPWGANTVKTMTLATPYVVPTTGLYYVGKTVVATTVPTQHGLALSDGITPGLAPILTGNTSRTGLTTPVLAPADFGIITPAATSPYAYIS